VMDARYIESESIIAVGAVLLEESKVGKGEI
jgi:carbonic anhydrase/acetyltransferase-like protein (isoleucine patch superfamily)